MLRSLRNTSSTAKENGCCHRPLAPRNQSCARRHDCPRWQLPYHICGSDSLNILKENLPVQDELVSLHDAMQKSIALLRSYGAERVDHGNAALHTSIPGIGPAISATLVAEIEDVARFERPQSLIAYAGLDPKVRQSGATLKRNTKITKRGSPYLRRSAYLAASIGQRYDPDLKKYFLKKLAEGKRYKEATVANARHILNRVYTVWKRGTPYVKNPHYA